MAPSASDLTYRLGREAEAVCRHYLSNGRRQGRYWLVGDVQNNPGRSMFVRLTGCATGKGAAGKWTDAATGEHGDLLDVIAASCGLVDFADIIQEASRFLALPRPVPDARPRRAIASRQAGSQEAARRLFAMSSPIRGTVAAAYLYRRGITSLHDAGSLRFHPCCYYRPDDHSATEIWPAMVASVTDLEGRQTGVHRTWLAPDGNCKAPVVTPRRAMGELLGNAVRFGMVQDVMAAGEGIETVLSVKMTLPRLPVIAALSAAHLGAVSLPVTVRRLYIVSDNDQAGEGAREQLSERAHAAGIEVVALLPQLGDFNDDLRRLGVDALRTAISTQIRRQDFDRFRNSAF